MPRSLPLVSLAAAVALAAGATAAAAKPLPAGMKVTSKDQKLFVTAGGLTVPMVDPEVQDREVFGDLTGAALSDDGATVLVTVGRCSGDDAPFEVPLAAVQARLENARGMQAHRKKKYDDAIAHFTIAAAADRDHPVYATNLLSAQSMAKKLDDADRTLATYGPAHVAWFAWRLAVDPELAAVVDRPAARALRAPAPGTLTFKQLGDAIAISPRGLVAVPEWSLFGGPGTSGDDELAIYDLATRAPVLRLPAHPAARAKEVDRVLAALGFEKRATAWVDRGDRDDQHVAAPDGTTVTLGDQGARITRGKTVVTADVDEDARKVGFAGDVVVFQYRESGFAGCSGDAQRSWSAPVRVK